ncbi:unnamed protein product [Tetraodon nigroviridis]|uniref:Chromosome 21 SCAF15022, whole genome shotgun sequence n=1 Tax=Tetraodon nigroviridis TaxID=99883 RepID=Q4RLA0_TETNG|nr:unnamed protein product [Tetraodon nigroviridis]
MDIWGSLCVVLLQCWFCERGLYQWARMVSVQWKRGQWAHHQREAEAMNEEQRPLL